MLLLLQDESITAEEKDANIGHILTSTLRLSNLTENILIIRYISLSYCSINSIPNVLAASKFYNWQFLRIQLK